jgi:hypothetical protein
VSAAIKGIIGSSAYNMTKKKILKTTTGTNGHLVGIELFSIGLIALKAPPSL